MPCPPALRAPDLFRALRAFCLGAFFDLGARDRARRGDPGLVRGARRPDRPTLYEYRPLVGAFVEARAQRLGRRDDAQDALDALKDEPAAGIFAQAHAEERVGEDEALRRTVLLPLLVRTAEGCGRIRLGRRASSRALTPSSSTPSSASAALRRARSARRPHGRGDDRLGRRSPRAPGGAGELTASWPEAGRLFPRDFGREVDRTLVIELECDPGRGPRCQVPDAPDEVGLAVSALRLATPGRSRPGPVLFERLDWRPYGVRPVPPLAAQVPRGEPNRLDPFRGRLAVQLSGRLAEAPRDPDLLEALERWELALFHEGPQRADELREALEALLGCDEGGVGGRDARFRAPRRVPPRARRAARRVRALLDGDGPGAHAEDAVRRALVETLLHGDRARARRVARRGAARSSPEAAGHDGRAGRLRGMTLGGDRLRAGAASGFASPSCSEFCLPSSTADDWLLHRDRPRGPSC